MDDLRSRRDAFRAEARQQALSTGPADRPDAEAAVISLYRRAGLPPPIFHWARSPLAGVLLVDRLEAAGEATPITGPGSRPRGMPRDLLELDRGWLARREKHLRLEHPSIRPEADVSAEGRLVRAAVTNGLRIALTDHVEASRERWPLPAFEDADARLAEIGRAMYGESWAFLAGWIGEGPLVMDFRAQFRNLLAGSVTKRINQFGARWDDGSRPGQFDVQHRLIAAARDVHDIRMLRRHGEHLDDWLTIARSTGPWWSYAEVAVMCERPLVIRLDPAGRPHAEDGPAIAYPDGFEVYAWHGVAVEPWVIRDPGRITIEAIDRERNAEVRRAMAERFGYDRLVREGGATLVHQDETGRLWRRPLAAPLPWGRSPEPIVVIEVVNATPEPDGSRKTYFLRVPPDMATAREAVAWTFGLESGDYAPARES